MSFNGAALFQVRKAQNWKQFNGYLEASMGPHSFKCGKVIRPSTKPLPIHASMGPHSFKCGKDIDGFESMFVDGASMGPHSFKCGKIFALLFRWQLG